MLAANNAHSSPTPRTFYAHSLPDQPPGNWEPLEDHLHQVADQAATFATKFHAAPWAHLAGLWHDVGKYSEAFQVYLYKVNGVEAHLEQYQGRVDHSTAGARHAVQTIPNWGRLLAFLIAGHHAGLADVSQSSACPGTSCLEERLRKNIEPIPDAPADVLHPAITLDKPPLNFEGSDQNAAGFRLAFFIRMLFSCLVDADFLATEGFMKPDRAADRPFEAASFSSMQSALRQALEVKAARAERGIVSRCRQDVLAACRNAASEPPGLFSLTVPTGGGKTLSSLSFAVDHAIEVREGTHHLRHPVHKHHRADCQRLPRCL